MSLSTFCRWALQSQNPAEHTKCAGTNCDCDCHRDVSVVRGRRRLVCPHPGCVRSFAHNEQRQLANHVRNMHDTALTDYPPELLEPPELPDTNGATMTPAPTEDPVTTIAEHREQSDAPDHEADEPKKRTRRVWTDEDKRRILAEIAAAPTKKEVLDKYNLSPSVVLNWGRDPGGTTTTPRKPPREAPPEPDAPPAPDDQAVDVDKAEDEFEICITVSSTERDVLDALGFLEGHGDATNYLVHYVTQMCAELGDESDVKLVLAARRGRAIESE